MTRLKEIPQAMASEMQKTKIAVSSSVGGESKKRFGVKFFGKLIFFLVFLGAIGAAGYFYYQYKKVIKNDQTTEIATLIKELSKVMDLPTDETPTLATVTDKEKLASQPFFKNAQNDDKVLIYVKSGKAILYRPTTHKIVDVSTINVTNDQQPQTTSDNTSNTASQTTTAASTDSHPTLALYNGAKTLGLTYKVEEQIKGSFSNVDVTRKEPAAKRDYTKTVVVDVSGRYASTAIDIAKNLGVEIKNLPDGEVKPDTDVLIIIGEDKAR